MEEEIDLRKYWDLLRKRWAIVVALPLIAALTSGVYSYFFIKHVYEASTTLLVGEKALEPGQEALLLLDKNVLLANQQLAITYGIIAQSRTVEQKVLKDLNLRELDSPISVNQVKDSEILEIKVAHTNPVLAATIANTFAQEFSKTVIDLKKVDSVSILDPAVTPTNPIKPNKKQNVLIAFIVGLMAAIGLVFLLEYLDNSVKTLSDVENLLGIPVLGVIPNYGMKKKGHEGKILSEYSLITAKQTYSSTSEAFRTLRTNVQFSSVDSKIKKILITSAGTLQGKSSTVANLAVSMAQSGKSVLVLDADLRNPVQHKIFRLNNGRGLSVALVEDQDCREYAWETSVPGLMVLTAGPIPPNPAELIGSKRMNHLIQEVSKQFDMVLIDTPPVVAVTDAAILAQEVDGVILVLASGEVNKEYAQSAKELLEKVGAKILGAVLNKVDMKTDEYLLRLRRI